MVAPVRRLNWCVYVLSYSVIVMLWDGGVSFNYCTKLIGWLVDCVHAAAWLGVPKLTGFSGGQSCWLRRPCWLLILVQRAVMCIYTLKDTLSLGVFITVLKYVQGSAHTLAFPCFFQHFVTNIENMAMPTYSCTSCQYVDTMAAV